MDLIETLNRTMKLAMDDGRVGSYEEAKALFESFKLRIHVKSGFAAVPAAQAAVLTLLNAAPKTFLGGVELMGAVQEQCTMAWFAGQTLGKVAQSFGAIVAEGLDEREVSTIYVGDYEVLVFGQWQHVAQVAHFSIRTALPGIDAQAHVYLGEFPL